MEYIYIGKLVNTHGIKGEVRIVSDFELKKRVFVESFPIYIGPSKEKNIIRSYRHHKNFEMVTLEGINNINDVLKYKGLNVYVNKEDLNLEKEEYLESDLIGMKVLFNGKEIGTLDNIEINGLNKLMIINNKLIPYNKHFIDKVDLENKIITLINVEGLI